MRRKIVNILLGLLFLAGLGVLSYPTIADQWNSYRQQRLISDYKTAVAEMSPEDFTAAWEAARAYNDSFEKNNIYGDVFGTESLELEDTEYWKVLNIAGNGVMGYLTIPKIDIQLSIYHGTSEDVLQTGVGHMNGTKLPIGGESTHSVLSAHRGLPSAKLFTDIDQLEAGDCFYIHVLDEDLAYEVDQILPMVDKDDMETLSSALQVVEGQDYVTLFTCTPYGVNSHRLLVRGHRVPYDGDMDPDAEDSLMDKIKKYYMLFLLAGLAVTALAILVIRKFSRTPRKRKGGTGKEGEK